jgi:hypothetical protein
MSQDRACVGADERFSSAFSGAIRSSKKSINDRHSLTEPRQSSGTGKREVARRTNRLVERNPKQPFARRSLTQKGGRH